MLDRVSYQDLKYARRCKLIEDIVIRELVKQTLEQEKSGLSKVDYFNSLKGKRQIITIRGQYVLSTIAKRIKGFYIHAGISKLTMWNRRAQELVRGINV